MTMPTRWRRGSANGAMNAQIAVTVLRTGKVWATVIVTMNGSGHWYTQRARLDDMRLRTEYLAVDAISDKVLEQLP